LKTYKIASEYSEYPGSRYISEGMYSGEDFRENHLSKIIKECLDNDETLKIDLDGTAGYSCGFLEEAFGGLIRENNFKLYELLIALRFKSEDLYLIKEIISYMTEASIDKYDKLAKEKKKWELN